jgi:hypothetical protein
MKWKDAVRLAIARHCRVTKSDIFSRKSLIQKELARIVSDTNAKGATPEQTLSRILQELRNAGEIEFVDDHGIYCKLF